jgi:hypothetical protein
MAQPEKPADGSEALLTQAKHALKQMEKEPSVLVWTDREQPSPLVRDSVKKWRTGRLDRVMQEDFDLF